MICARLVLAGSAVAVLGSGCGSAQKSAGTAQTTPQTTAGTAQTTAYVYWANDNGVYVNTSFVVGQDAGIGGTLVGQTPGAVNAVTAFAVGSMSVYYGEDGYVEKSPPTSQTAGTVVTDILARNVPVFATDDAGTHEPMPNSIAVDGTNVYWSNANATGALMKIPKSCAR